MGNKEKSKNKKDGEIRIITDKQKNSEYTFVDDGLTNHLTLNHSIGGQSEELKKEEKNNDISHSLMRHSDKSKKNNMDYMRFKSNKVTKSQSKQNHSPVYE
jgi:hypothetical protein